MKSDLANLRVLTLAFALCAASLTAAAPVSARDYGGNAAIVDADARLAQRDDDRGRVRGGSDARPFVPLEVIIANIQARTPGRMIGVRGPDGSGHYRIVWETPDGRVITIIADARTGRILR